MHSRTLKLLAVILFLCWSMPLLSLSQENLRTAAIMQRLDSISSGEQALGHAGFFTQFWRIGGGPGFDASMSYVADQLEQAGFVHSSTRGSVENGRAAYDIQENPLPNLVWVPENVSLEIIEPDRRMIATYRDTPLLLCRNSFPQDTTATMVYVRGGARPSDYDGIDVAGTVVLCDVHPAAAFSHARQRGAIGVISSFVPEYNRPDLYPHLVAEGFIPYDEETKSFGLMVSRAIGDDLKHLIAQHRVGVRVRIAATFITSSLKTLVAELPGASRPEERIVLVAHLDHYKPGANDNASGSATLLEIARVLSASVQDGSLPRPERTITFLWVDEYAGTSAWLTKQADASKSILAALVMDMVGGNPERTGGTFRVERMPDPGVIWTRPPDQHSGWGTGTWDQGRLSGSFLNDFFLEIVRQRVEASGWKTTQNVWEGGSDHDIFLRAGIPALLNWHWPDFAYHSSMDVLANLSAIEMKQVAVTVGTAALVLAYGKEHHALEILDAVTSAAQKRVASETENARNSISRAQQAGPGELAATQRKERAVFDAWMKWYDEAIQSVSALPSTKASGEFRRAVESRRRSLSETAARARESLGLHE
jgi:aminopeptidase YwaD